MASERTQTLVVNVGARSCAIPLHHVTETMRPLAIEPVTGMPDFVLGVSVIRGAPVPVVDLKTLLGSGDASLNCRRFVTLKLGERRVALAVDDVVGSRTLDSSELRELPSLMGDVAADFIEALGTRDAELLVVLRAASIVPAEVWARLAIAEVSR